MCLCVCMCLFRHLSFCVRDSVSLCICMHVCVHVCESVSASECASVNACMYLGMCLLVLCVVNRIQDVQSNNESRILMNK